MTLGDSDRVPAAAAGGDWDEAEVLRFLRWFYMLSDDPLVVNVRTNVSDEERARVQANWPGLRSRKKPRLELPPNGKTKSASADSEKEIPDDGSKQGGKGGKQRSLDKQDDGDNEASRAEPAGPPRVALLPLIFAIYHCVMPFFYFG